MCLVIRVRQVALESLADPDGLGRLLRWADGPRIPTAGVPQRETVAGDRAVGRERQEHAVGLGGVVSGGGHRPGDPPVRDRLGVRVTAAVQSQKVKVRLGVEVSQVD